MTGFTTEQMQELARILEGRRVGRRLVHLASCSSTQDVAQRIAVQQGAAPEGLVVVADDQEEGRGRMGRRWRQRPKEDLSFSLVLAPPATVPPVALAALLPVAVCLGIEEGVGRGLALKWPNDVMLDGRKLAGTLIEAFRAGEKESGTQAYAVGVGINVNATAFDPEIAASAVSLRQALGHPVDRAGLFASVLLEIDAAWSDVLASKTERLVEVLRNRLALVGKEVELARGSERVRGVVTGLGLEGFVLRLASGGERKLALETVTAAVPCSTGHSV